MSVNLHVWRVKWNGRFTASERCRAGFIFLFFLLCEKCLQFKDIPSEIWFLGMYHEKQFKCIRVLHIFYNHSSLEVIRAFNILRDLGPFEPFTSFRRNYNFEKHMIAEDIPYCSREKSCNRNTHFTNKYLGLDFWKSTWREWWTRWHSDSDQTSI